MLVMLLTNTAVSWRRQDYTGGRQAEKCVWTNASGAARAFGDLEHGRQSKWQQRHCHAWDAAFMLAQATHDWDWWQRTKKAACLREGVSIVMRPA